MKNLIIALSLFFALGATAQAKKTPVKAATPKATVQAPKLTNAQAAKKNINDLAAFITLDDQTKIDAEKLFLSKQQMLHDENGQELSAERKAVIAQIIDRKLALLIGTDNVTKVRANAALHESLIN